MNDKRFRKADVTPAKLELVLNRLGFKRVPSESEFSLWQRTDASGPNFLTLMPPAFKSGFDEASYSRNYVIDLLNSLRHSFVITPADALKDTDEAVTSAWDADWHALGESLSKAVGQIHVGSRRKPRK